MGSFARNKGKRGERRVIDWLQPLVDAIAKELTITQVLLQRNPNQSDKGGVDMIGLDWMSAEIKNVEARTPAVMAGWWQETLAQTAAWPRPDGSLRTPILFYLAHQKIRVRMQGVLWHEHAPGSWHHCLVDIAAHDFEPYFALRTRQELERKPKAQVEPKEPL